MEVEFVKISPTQNMTILVRSPVARAQQPRLAERLMDPCCVGAEQVGFLEPAAGGARVRLQMMGGEFCGNASMATGAYLARADGLADGGEAMYALEVSGADAPVRVRIRRAGSAYVGTVGMPPALGVETLALAPGVRVPLVRFAGIAHALVPEETLGPEEMRARIADLCRACGAEALGLLRVDAAFSRIEPLVYVRETGSCVWERGCGSGSAAVGVYLAARRGGRAECALAQPGGTIGVRAELSGEAPMLEITGRVCITAEGRAWID